MFIVELIRVTGKVFSDAFEAIRDLRRNHDPADRQQAIERILRAVAYSFAALVALAVVAGCIYLAYYVDMHFVQHDGTGSSE